MGALGLELSIYIAHGAHHLSRWLHAVLVDDPQWVDNHRELLWGLVHDHRLVRQSCTHDME